MPASPLGPEQVTIRGYRTRQVYRQLLDRIQRRHRPGDRLAGQIDLARELHCSVTVVKQAMAALVEQGWVTRSKHVGTFVTGGPGRVLSGARMVGLLSDLHSESFLHARVYREMFLGLALRLAEQGVGVQLLRTEVDEGPHLAQRRLESADLSQLAGLVAMNVEAPEPLETIGRTMPVVLMERSKPYANCSTIIPDHRAAVRAAIEHLWTLGHRRIGFSGKYYVADPPERPEPRYDWYVSEMLAHGINPPHEWMLPAWNLRDWRQSARRFAAMPPADRPTALLVRHATWLVLHELETNGVRVGTDVSAVALEVMVSWQEWLDANQSLAAIPGAAVLPANERIEGLDAVGQRMASFSPTTATMDTFAIGQAAADELVRRLSDLTSEPRSVLAAASFHVGNTTGPPR
ncbi:MAG: substrate-binding domain-containing protein [Phycisphaerae bacterium]|nr:substrate-binding domain-containing protein [Phycisphaerae bacterium]